MSERYEYGNARLRARRATLFDAVAYDHLSGTTLDGLLGALGSTPYGPDVAQASLRSTGLDCLHEALRTNLARTLAEMQTFYEGGARERVDLIVGRWDLRNLRTLLRGLVRHVPPERILPLLVPTAHLDATDLHELATQRGVREALGLLTAWRVVDTTIVDALLEGWALDAGSGDLASLEFTLDRAWALRVDRSLDGAPATLQSTMRSELDASNLLTVVRLWTARSRSEPISGGPRKTWPFLPGGTVPHRLLESALAGDRADEVARTISAGPIRSEWRRAIERWAADLDVVALGDRLEAAITRHAIGLFASGDALSVDVPIAYTWTKENEVRNLRMIGAGLAAHIEPSSFQEGLVIPW